MRGPSLPQGPVLQLCNYQHLAASVQNDCTPTVSVKLCFTPARKNWVNHNTMLQLERADIDRTE